MDSTGVTGRKRVRMESEGVRVLDGGRWRLEAECSSKSFFVLLRFPNILLHLQGDYSRAQDIVNRITRYEISYGFSREWRSGRGGGAK
jgi:hypothetical protein